MKFFPESKKKLVWSIVLLIISTAGIIYVNFFTGRPKRADIPTQQNNVPLSRTRQPVGEEGQVASGGLLPHGSKINLQILQDERFTVLKRVAPVTVTPEELGKSDLFGKQ